MTVKNDLVRVNTAKPSGPRKTRKSNPTATKSGPKKLSLPKKLFTSAVIVAAPFMTLNDVFAQDTGNKKEGPKVQNTDTKIDNKKSSSNKAKPSTKKKVPTPAKKTKAEILKEGKDTAAAFNKALEKYEAIDESQLRTTNGTEPDWGYEKECIRIMKAYVAKYEKQGSLHYDNIIEIERLQLNGIVQMFGRSKLSANLVQIKKDIFGPAHEIPGTTSVYAKVGKELNLLYGLIKSTKQELNKHQKMHDKYSKNPSAPKEFVDNIQFAVNLSTKELSILNDLADLYGALGARGIERKTTKTQAKNALKRIKKTDLPSLFGKSVAPDLTKLYKFYEKWFSTKAN